MSYNNSDIITEFTVSLSIEKWELKCSSRDINTKFNSFLNTILRNLDARFPAKSGGERKYMTFKE
jgi:hypothetical protein